MLKQRVVAPEWLDTLAPDDPRARRSRGDLRRINRLMSASSLLARSLDALLAHAPGAPLVELGAGDGSLALRVARRLSPRWPNVGLGLLDLQPGVSDATLRGFDALGWTGQVIQADVLEWLARRPPAAGETARPIVFANLFVHHFEGARLQALLAGIADRAQAFVCLEPRRSPTALLGSYLLGAIGCNDVTRHDAVVSVRAGFVARELSACWPDARDWSLQETAAGLFGHRFAAGRQ
ncbi:MAG: hypothetical protein ABI128_00435 [Rhodanobacter sp.]